MYRRKTLYIGLTLAGILFQMWSCQDEIKVEESKLVFLTFKNTLAIDRIDAPVKISRGLLLKNIDSLPENNTVVLVDSTGSILPFRLEDVDNDGNWDEFNTTMNFKANETKKLQVKVVPSYQVPTFKQHTNIHFGNGKKSDKIFQILSYQKKQKPGKINSLFFLNRSKGSGFSYVALHKFNTIHTSITNTLSNPVKGIYE
ncbi:DUF4861 family protein [Aquimarina sp. ERC-38]|uniref:DUF4861 family protein n=1 Tax=Aquimarina sp. ERC-38 TaxID=2949996 RepID=UPI002246EF39|nr:DUF4861 family protein [Aquimarina sp. ERC-38]UZO81573.1 DUF4861 family protein [Aquimarina sp. ERC-38]